MVTFEDFQKIDIRVGKIIDMQEFPQAHKPSYVLTIDLGPDIGIKKSCAQLTANYAPQTLLGKQVLCVVNFPVRQVGPHLSQVLTLGVPDEQGQPILVQPEREIPLGGALY